MPAESRRWLVDASVAFGWFVAVPGSTQAVRLLEAAPPARLLAPDLVLIQLLNAGWKSHRIGAITTEPFDAMALRAAEPFAALVPATELLPRARRWCERLDHPACDCLYVALAERDDATVVTADRRLLGRLTGSGMDRPDVLELADLASIQVMGAPSPDSMESWRGCHWQGLPFRPDRWGPRVRPGGGGVEAARAIEPLCMLWCIPGFLRNEWAHAFKLLT
jgi:predicted nucleic acid-binding protein